MASTKPIKQVERNQTGAISRVMLVESANTIYEGTLVSIKANGRAVVGTTTLPCAGVAVQSKAGGNYVTVYFNHVVEYSLPGVADSDIDKPCYIYDNDTLTLTANSALVGKIVQVNTTTSKVLVHVSLTSGGSGGTTLHADLTDLATSGHPADIISYDNTTSGLSATDVQTAIDEIDDDLDNHIADTSNPHSVTKTQVGLGNVPNLDTTDAVNNEHTHSNKAQLDLVTDGDHDVRTDNPHGVTHSQLSDPATNGHPADIISYNNTIEQLLLSTDVQGAIDEIVSRWSWINRIKNRIDNFYATDADVVLSTTGAGDLQTAINALTEKQVLEIQANATYSPITLPTDKSFIVRVKEGYEVKMTGANCITIADGCRNILIQGILFEGCSTATPNEKGSAICLAHQAIATDIIIYDCCFSLCTGSAVMLSYHQTIGGDNYATANTFPNEFSTKIAFVRNYFYKSCNDTTEGANISVRGIQYFLAWENLIDVANTGGRGIQLQNCIDAFILDNRIENCLAGNGEAIKIDRLGAPAYYNSGHVVKNVCKNCYEGVDIDDFVYGTVEDNICYQCTEEGITIDNDSKAIIIGNWCFSNVDGIRLESGATANLKSNVCWDNSNANYRMDSGQTYDASNTTDPANTFIIPSNILFNQVVYEDIRIIPGSFDYAGVADPNLVNYQPGGSGTVLKLYEFAQNDIAYATIQVPHNYKQGTNMTVHVHWTPGTRGNEESGNTVAWKCAISWANIDAAFPTATIYDMTDTCDGTDHKHQMTPVITVTGSGKTISSQLLIAIYRDTGDTWATNTTGNLPLFIELDLHYQVDTAGSRSETTK